MEFICSPTGRRSWMPTSFLGSLYEKTGRLYWIDPQVQDLVQKQRAEADPAKRRAIIGEILKLSAQQFAVCASL